MGVTYYGGPGDEGLIYAMGMDGSHYTVLRTLGGSAGANPGSGLSRDANGTL